MTSPTHLFVYGTLLSGIPSSMSKFLRRRGELVGAATASGRLYDLGGYPGFVGGSGTVKGELYRIKEDRARETWDLLDAYEGVTGAAGEQYRKVTLDVRVNGSVQEATTYEYTGKTKGVVEIPDGDYPPYYANNPEHLKFTGND